MKKYLFLGFIIILSLTACGKDEVVKKVSDDIDSIGEVTLDDEVLINKTYVIYNTLTDKQKNQIDNYADLLEAMDEIAILKEEAMLQKIKEDAEAEAEKEAYLELERMHYAYILKAVQALPDNSEVNSIICEYSQTFDIYYRIYISVGKKETWYGYIDNYGIFEEKNMTEYLNAIEGKSDTYCYKIGENFYCTHENMNADYYKCIFMVDIEDFNEYCD